MKPLPKIIDTYQKLTLGFNYYEVYDNMLIFLKVHGLCKWLIPQRKRKGDSQQAEHEDLEELIKMT